MINKFLNISPDAPYIVSCCSTVDLSAEKLEAMGVSYACFNYFLDGKELSDDLGKSLSSKEFYNAMVAGADTKTSQINAAEYEDYFGELLATGKDVLHITLSSGLSGSYRSACLAAEELREKYPDRKLVVVDSLGASAGSGLLTAMAADLRDGGKTIEDAAAWLEENKLNVHLWFFSTDLTFYVKGGRVSKAAGWFGTALKICPLLNMSHEGKLIPREKVRTKPRVVKAIVEKMSLMAQNGTNYDGKCFISHSDCLEDAEAVKSLIEESFPSLVGKVEIYNIGTVIGSHTGPGTVALFFLGNKRED
jgi:DegV family protein with EDD domain